MELMLALIFFIILLDILRPAEYICKVFKRRYHGRIETRQGKREAR